jgi:polyphosphate kinase
MIAATDTGWAPWFVVDNDDKKRGQLNIISHLLSQIPYEPLPSRDVQMPRKPNPRGYSEPELPCTTSRRPSRGADRTRTMTEKKEWR